MTATPNQTEQIARRFASLLRKTLTTHEMNAVVTRNRQPNYAGCCASHDFCDANEVMAQALTDVTGQEVDVRDGAQLRLWNAAWDVARGREFRGF